MLKPIFYVPSSLGGKDKINTYLHPSINGLFIDYCIYGDRGPYFFCLVMS